MSDAPTGAIVEHERPTGFLGLMRNRNYALLWWGQLVSEMGNRFHWVAVSLWVYSATRSASAVSFAISSMFVGGLLISLWAGVLVDRLNRKTIMITADLVRAVLVALIPTLMGLHIWLVYLDLALISVATAFFRPAIFAVVPQVVSRRDLLPANSFFSAMDTGTEILGPAVAGILAFRYGYAPLLYLDAVTYLVSAIFIVGMLLSPLTGKTAGSGSLKALWGGVVEGLRYIRGDRLQWGLFVLIFPAYLVGSGLNALQTPLAKGLVRISDAEFGTFNSVWGIGFFAASLLLGWYGARISRSVLILGGFFLAFSWTALMGVSSTFEALLVTAFGVGFSNTLYFVGMSTALMEHTPQDIIGRVVSTRQVALGLTRVLSPLVFGSVADSIGVRSAILLMALVGASGTAVVTLVWPKVRQFDGTGGRISRDLLPLRSVAGGPVDREIDEDQQKTLNILTVGVVLLAWLVLLFRVPYHALGLFVVTILSVYAGSFLRRKGLLG